MDIAGYGLEETHALYAVLASFATAGSGGGGTGNGRVRKRDRNMFCIVFTFLPQTNMMSKKQNKTREYVMVDYR